MKRNLTRVFAALAATLSTSTFAYDPGAINQAPEPGILALLAAGGIAIALVGYRRKGK